MTDENQIRNAAKSQGLSATDQEGAVSFARSHPDITDAEQVVREYKKSK